MLNGPVAQSAPTVSPLGVIDIAQVCGLLGVSRSWIEAQIRGDKTFPRLFRIGARRHMRFDDLKMWVEQRARAA
jgi:predicted DNA-binding transcriptional regulator AlpA